MSKLKLNSIIFDINGTLDSNIPAQKLYEIFSELNWKIYIHSNCGIDYAKKFIKDNGLNAIPKSKDDLSEEYDIAIDDNEEIKNAKITIKV